MSWSLRFDLGLTWIDDRLYYQNLNEDQFQNLLSDDIASKIWKPRIVFKNRTKEEQRLEYESVTSDITLIRNGISKEAPLSQPDEARVFKSSQTEIHWWSVHLKKFRCHFKLHYFPFDQQSCYVQVRKLQQKINSIHPADSVY